MIWENKLNNTSYLSLKDKKGIGTKYITLEDANKIAKMAWNEALSKVEEIYSLEKDIVSDCKELKL